MQRWAAFAGAVGCALLLWALLRAGAHPDADLGPTVAPPRSPEPAAPPPGGAAGAEPAEAARPGPTDDTLRERLLRVRVVRDVDGMPVANARVVVWQQNSSDCIGELTTDRAGAAECAMADRLADDEDYRTHRQALLALDVLVSAPGLGHIAARDWAYTPGAWWEVRLPPLSLVRGQVRDDRGRPLGGAAIECGPDAPSSWYGAPDRTGSGPSTTSDPEGRFELRLGTGIWTVRASALGHATDEAAVMLDGPEAICQLTLRVRPGLTLRVVDHAGVAVPDATVVYRHPSTGGWMAPPFHVGRTDATGRHAVPLEICTQLEDTVGSALAFDAVENVYRAKILGMGVVVLWPAGHARDRWPVRGSFDEAARFASGTINWGPGPPPDRVSLGLDFTQAQLDEMAQRDPAWRQLPGRAAAATERQTVEMYEQFRAEYGVDAAAWTSIEAGTRFRMVWFRAGETRLQARGVGPGAQIRFGSVYLDAAEVHRDLAIATRAITRAADRTPVEVRARLVWDRDGQPAVGVVCPLGRGDVSDADGRIRVEVEPWAASTGLLQAQWRVAAPPEGGWPGIAAGSGPIDLGTLRVLPRERISLVLVGRDGQPLTRGDWEVVIAPPAAEDAPDWRGTGPERRYVPPTRLMARSRLAGSFPAQPSGWVPDHPGRVEVNVRLPGVQPWERRFAWHTLARDGVVRVDQRAPPTRETAPSTPPKLQATLRGTIRNAAGDPLPGVRVGHGWGGGARMAIVQSPWGYHYTDAAGQLVFPLAELDEIKPLEVPVRLPGFVERIVHVAPLAGADGYPPLQLTLERSHRLVVWLPGSVAPDQFEWQADGEIEARAIEGVAATYRVPAADGSDGRPWWSAWYAGDRFARVGGRWQIEIEDLVPGVYEVTATKMPGVDSTPQRVTVTRGAPTELTLPAAR